MTDVERPATGGQECSTPCDADCDADCHEFHQPRGKREHHPEDCGGYRPTAAPADPVRAYLDQLAVAHAAATAGPWRVHQGMTVRAPGGDPRPVATMGRYTDGLRDAAAIVAARNALPALLSVVRELADLADELDAEVTPRSFHPAGTHSDGASTAYRITADRIRTVLSRLAPEEGAR